MSMKISELSAASGLPIATIKYYLREGLLRPGTRTAANQAAYSGEHLHRLRLIRALVEVGQLPITTARDVLAAVDDEDTPMHDALGVAHHALSSRHPAHPVPDDEAIGEVDAFVDDMGWQVNPLAPARRELAQVLGTLRLLGWEVTAEVFRPYADAADRLAAWELDRSPAGNDRSGVVEYTMVGTVVFEVALLALRRLAQEHHSSARYR